jgi:hypothetical protein
MENSTVNSISEIGFVTKFTHLQGGFGKIPGLSGFPRPVFLKSDLSRLYKGNRP